MKHKLSFVYEKDEEIGKLKDKITSLNKDIKQFEEETKEVIKLRLANKELQIENEQLQSKLTTLHTLESENILLRDKLKEPRASDELVIEDIEDSDGEIDDEDIEMMDVNIPQLRHVLVTRLKHKQARHIESLITSYGLRRKNKVSKVVMERLLEEAIHL